MDDMIRKMNKNIATALGAKTHEQTRTVDEAKAVAAKVGYPVEMTPSFQLGGVPASIVQDDAALEREWRRLVALSPLAEVGVRKA